jgi:hypothetical protein
MYSKTPQNRLDARSDFDEWARSIVAAVETHRSPWSKAPTQTRFGLRGWVSRVFTKIAD